MSETAQSPTKASFRFQNFVVKESHIVLNQQGENKINIEFSPKGYVFASLSQFHLELNVDITEEDNSFSIQLQTLSFFEFDATSENFTQFRDDYFIRNAPAIVFPYIRAYISNLTTQSGLFTVQLPTLNLSNLAESLKINIVETE